MKASWMLGKEVKERICNRNNRMEKRFEVKTYIVHLYCDECNVLLEQRTGVVSEDPDIYQYCCLSCNKVYKSKNQFPHTRYEVINPEASIMD